MRGTAIYSLPGSDVFCKISGDVVTGDQYSRIRSGFVFCPFRTSDENPALAIEGEIEEWNGEPENIYRLPLSTKTSCTSKEDYLKLVGQAIGLCRHGHEKVVTSRCLCEAFELPGPPVEFVKKLRERYPNAFTYCFYVPGKICYIGASPETLVEQEGDRYRTMALAGTRLKSEGSHWTEKERLEHQTVVGYIVDKLRDEQMLRVGETYDHQAAHLLHLRTDVLFKSNRDILELAEILHPTPAICGMPAGLSESWLRHHEGYDRHYYAGFLGPVSPKNGSHLFVNLRCMQLFRDQVCFYAGGGINALSDPGKEWQETEEKINVLRNLVIGQ